ncbi:hypothetical protein K432DRAFT_456072 [Lepidopterella palustris CBS 459.81]|uniref:Uncharacterized protein n=1 Tax=Lepidopterella palustris CBS 459.81 TaxID=1314670 RepID=A0A8E2DW70_9PEZI|nr:hypothetical protein K432DRAFT_456072 [Lepidopterella palustris CBS 459.81]
MLVHHPPAVPLRGRQLPYQPIRYSGSLQDTVLAPLLGAMGDIAAMHSSPQSTLRHNLLLAAIYSSPQSTLRQESARGRCTRCCTLVDRDPVCGRQPCLQYSTNQNARILGGPDDQINSSDIMTEQESAQTNLPYPKRLRPKVAEAVQGSNAPILIVVRAWMVKGWGDSSRHPGLCFIVRSLSARVVGWCEGEDSGAPCPVGVLPGMRGRCVLVELTPVE